MQSRSPVAGLVSVVAGVLAAAVSFFRLLPELSKFDVDNIADVALAAGIYATGMAILAVFLHLIYQILRRGKATIGLFATLLTFAVWLGVGFMIAGIAGAVLYKLDVATDSLIRWQASVMTTVLIVGPLMAYRRWMQYRPEREKQCFQCREWIHLDANRCRHCTSNPIWLTGTPPESPGWPKWFSGF
jgi:hypothetical protein